MEAVLAWRHTYGEDPEIVEAATVAARASVDRPAADGAGAPRRARATTSSPRSGASARPSCPTGARRTCSTSAACCSRPAPRRPSHLIATCVALLAADEALERRVRDGARRPGPPRRGGAAAVDRRARARARGPAGRRARRRDDPRRATASTPSTRRPTATPRATRDPTSSTSTARGQHSHLAFNVGPRHCVGAALARHRGGRGARGPPGARPAPPARPRPREPPRYRGLHRPQLPARSGSCCGRDAAPPGLMASIPADDAVPSAPALRLEARHPLAAGLDPGRRLPRRRADLPGRRRVPDEPARARRARRRARPRVPAGRRGADRRSPAAARRGAARRRRSAAAAIAGVFVASSHTLAGLVVSASSLPWLRRVGRGVRQPATGDRHRRRRDRRPGPRRRGQRRAGPDRRRRRHRGHDLGGDRRLHRRGGARARATWTPIR